MSRELPILFNTEMVRAILDGRKTCTRRVVKLPKSMSGRPVGKNGDIGFMYPGGIKRPPCHQGDILYVRETWGEGYEDGTYIYKASDKLANHPMFKESSKLLYHPSIHMPKEAARIWLKVTDVRVERLQDIDGKGCVKEGIEEEPLKDVGDEFVKGMFHDLWDSTIKKSDLDRYGWKANPWVWVIDFERCDKPKEE